MFLFNMKHKNKLLFFVLFVFKELLSVQCIPAQSLQYDITKDLDKWFSKLFTFEPGTSKVRKSFSAAEHYNLEKVEYILNREIEHFQKKFLFVDVHFYMHRNDIEESSKTPSQVHWNLPKNQICVMFNKLRITVRAKLRASQNETKNKLFTTLNFRNFTLCATAPTSIKNKTIDFDIFYGSYILRNHGCGREIQWSGENGENIVLTTQEELTQETKPALLGMLRENIKRNTNFFTAFDTLFKDFAQINEEITSNHPGILNQEQKYYYLIPKIPFHRFALTSIIIKGLSNVESLKIYFVPDIFTRSLLIKHLRGNLILDYGSHEDAPKPLELSFRIDYLSISTRNKFNCAHVQAKYYGFNSTKGPLTYRQSTFLMERIESAIVSAVLPSKKAWRVCDIEAPINDLKDIGSTSEPNWVTIKESYKDWIPFPENEVVQIKIE